MPCKPDGGMNNCTTVRCPCTPSCGGTLFADGRNKLGTLTFLVCDACGCCHVAYDICGGGERERPHG